MLDTHDWLTVALAVLIFTLVWCVGSAWRAAMRACEAARNCGYAAKACRQYRDETRACHDRPITRSRI